MKNVAVSCGGSANSIHHGSCRGGDYTQIPTLIRLDLGKIKIETATHSFEHCSDDMAWVFVLWQIKGWGE